MAINGNNFVFFAQGLVLALFIFLRFFQLPAEVALAIAMHGGIAFIDAKLFCDLLFIDLIVGT